MAKKKKTVDVTKPGFTYLILITLTLIISNIISEYSFFKILEYPVLLSVFVYPFVYFFANLLQRKTNYKKVILYTFMAALVQSVVFIGAHFLTQTSIALFMAFGSIVSFVITMLLNAYLQQKAFKKKKTFGKSFVIYTGMLLLDSVIFLLIASQGIPQDFFMIVLLSNVVRLAIGLILSAIECLIYKQKNK